MPIVFPMPLTLGGWLGAAFQFSSTVQRSGMDLSSFAEGPGVYRNQWRTQEWRGWFLGWGHWLLCCYFFSTKGAQISKRAKVRFGGAKMKPRVNQSSWLALRWKSGQQRVTMTSSSSRFDPISEHGNVALTLALINCLVLGSGPPDKHPGSETEDEMAPRPTTAVLLILFVVMDLSLFASYFWVCFLFFAILSFFYQRDGGRSCLVFFWNIMCTAAI